MSVLLVVAAAGTGLGQDGTTAPAPAGGTTVPPPITVPAAASGAGAATVPAAVSVLRFAQITDAHLFDAGYKCSGAFVEREYQENLDALRWSVEEISRRWKSGERLDFVVFTGDLGIVNLAGGKSDHVAPDANSNCSEPDAKPSSYGPIAAMDFVTAETLLAKVLECLPSGLPVYFLPGNNDLTDEDPGTLWRYDQFVTGLRDLTHGRVADLNGRSLTVGGYTLVGLNSAGFKPQTYKDGTANEDTVRAGTVKSPGNAVYCDELDDATGSPRAKQKMAAIQTFAGLVSGPGPYLVFTHEPDLQDPYLPRRQNANTSSGGSCEFRSTWLLTKGARDLWQTSGLHNANVVAIFAGHFHSPVIDTYGGPQTNQAVALSFPPATGVKTAPIFVTPPLSVKNQWQQYPDGARGMAFVTVTGPGTGTGGSVVEQVDLYWTKAQADCCGTERGWFVAATMQYFHEQPEMAFVAAGVLTIILVVILLFLASTLDPQCQFTATGGHPFERGWRWLREHAACTMNQFSKLIVEGDTQSYSLSKLQFLLWTIATVYGYTYLWVAHTWVQGLPGIPDITGTFPWETVFAGGTAVVSQVSKSAFGTKGGGPLKPQLSDLISAGGVAAPGRIQFLSWTLVAVTAYLSSILVTDPCTVHLLPDVPPRLLDISMVSAVTYLAARATSTAGPLLTSAVFTPVSTPPPLGSPVGLMGNLLIIGNQLSKMAQLQAFQPSPATPPTGDKTAATGTQTDAVSGVDGIPIPGFKYATPPFTVDEVNAVPGSPGLYTQVAVQVLGGTLPASWTLRVQNPDGKYAEVQVATGALPPPESEPVPAPVKPPDGGAAGGAGGADPAAVAVPGPVPAPVPVAAQDAAPEPAPVPAPVPDAAPAPDPAEGPAPPQVPG